MSNSLTRAKLVNILHQQNIGHNKQEIRQYVDAVLDIMGNTLLSDEEVKLSGFGKLKTKNKAARIGRNPKTEEELIISRRKVISFQASKKLINALNPKQ